MPCTTGPTICRYRGDTVPFTVTILDSDGNPINITGFTLKLSVNPDESPTDEAGKLFTLTGTVTDGPNGVVQFEPNATEANQSEDDYYYDIEQVDGSSKIRTLCKGVFQFRQDITKT